MSRFKMSLRPLSVIDYQIDKHITTNRICTVFHANLVRISCELVAIAPRLCCDCDATVQPVVALAALADAASWLTVWLTCLC